MPKVTVTFKTITPDDTRKSQASKHVTVTSDPSKRGSAVSTNIVWGRLPPFRFNESRLARQGLGDASASCPLWRVGADNLAVREAETTEIDKGGPALFSGERLLPVYGEMRCACPHI